MDIITWFLNQYTLGRYTVFTTLINVFFAVSVFLFLNYLVERKKLKIDLTLFHGSASWILFGVSIRFLKDLDVVSTPISIFISTPFIYLEVFFLAMFVYFTVRKIWSFAPLFVTIPLLVFEILVAEKFNLLALLSIVFLLSLFFFFAKKVLKNKDSMYAFTGQMLDGVSTFVSLTFFNFYEEHILSNFVMSFFEKMGIFLFGSTAWSFLLVKFLLVFFTIKFLEVKLPENERYLFNFFIFVIGFAVGLRNTLNVVLLG